MRHPEIKLTNQDFYPADVCFVLNVFDFLAVDHFPGFFVDSDQTGTRRRQDSLPHGSCRVHIAVEDHQAGLCHGEDAVDMQASEDCF